jgi:peptidoglycan/xylan/chitin deacetylase (PgdA/CDA1 family)
MILLGVLVLYALPAVILAEVLRCVGLELRRDRIPILLYHRLISRREVEAGRIPDTEPIYACYDDAFAAQMEHLVAEGYTTLSLDDLLAIRRGTMPRPRKPIAITFDDGYASNHALAWPALRRHRLRATIFVAPQPDEHTREFVAGVDGFLTGDQMRELDQGGVAIESHTLTHCVLSELDDATARHELQESRQVLGAIVGRPIRHLAVPRSGHDWRIRRLAREEGYLTVCSNGKGSSNGWSSLFALPRIVVERDTSLQDFARALSPRGAVVLRLVGTLKRAPGLLLGPGAAMTIRRALLSGPLGVLLQTRRLVRVLAACAFLYALATALFTWYLVSR